MTRARDLSRLGNKNVITASATNNVGIGSTIPDTKLDVTGDANFTGVLTATSFVGDGSGITGVAATANVVTDSLVVSGVSTFNGAAGFDTHVDLSDNARLRLGDNQDLQIFSDGSNAFIKETIGSGSLYIDATNLVFREAAGSEKYAQFNSNGSVDLYYDASKKFETISTGATVTGDLYATTLYGDGSNLTGLPQSGIELKSAGSSVGTGITAINFESGATLTTASGGISTITIAAGGGSGEFNTGISSSVLMTPLGYESTMFTFPTTSGYQYTVDSINVANTSDTVGVGTSINIIVSIADTVGTGEQTYLGYNIPIADGGLVELLKNPFVAPPGAVIKAWTTRGSDYVGLSSVSDVYMNYTSNESTEYIVSYASTISIASTAQTGIYTSSTYPSNLQSIRLANRTDDGDYPVSVSINNGVTTTFLCKDLIVPRYAVVDILERQKRIEVDDIVQVSVGATATIDVILAGKQITS